MKKILILCLFLIAGIALIVLNKDKTENKIIIKDHTKDQRTIEQTLNYIEVSYFKSDKIRAWSIYLPNPTEAIARTIADKYDSYNASFSQKRICRVCFFDSKQYTPIWLNDISITVEQDRHQIAVFHHNPFSNYKSFDWLQ